MKKVIILACFVALGAMATSTQAQVLSLPGIFGGNRYDENKVYQDERGTYHYETRERRVWVPEQRSSGVLGTRVIPGHYETVREQVKIYHKRDNRYGRYDDRDDRYNTPGRYSKHPHGMPPGQRKKMEKDRYDSRYDERYDDRRYDSRYDDYNYTSQSKKYKK